MIAGGGIFMTVTGMEPTKTPGTVFANSWFDLGFAFVILGLLVTGIGVVLHFRREVQPRSAPPAVSAADGAPPLELNYYTRPAPEYGDWITAHFIAVANPDGQPERRAVITAEGMEPYPKQTPPDGAGPSFPYTLPSASGGNPEAGLLIKPGQEQSWLIGQTGTGDDGKMAVFGFGNPRKGRWELGPDESWRLSYRIRCDGVPDEVPFSIVVDSLDGKTIRVRRQG